mgnify:CR=1 FL=1
MSVKKSEEFKREAINLVLTSGLSQKQVAADLGIGKSTLGKWMSQHRSSPEGLCQLQADESIEAELRRLRKEVRVLKEEREILKKATQFFASQR